MAGFFRGIGVAAEICVQRHQTWTDPQNPLDLGIVGISVPTRSMRLSPVLFSPHPISGGSLLGLNTKVLSILLSNSAHS